MLYGKRVAVVGMGKIGGALVSGMIEREVIRREDLVGSTGHQESAQRVAERYGIKTYHDNAQMVTGREMVILAVKPYHMEGVLSEIKGVVTKDQLVITIAAAITTRFVEGHLGMEIPVVRAMPNTACLVGQGMTVLCSGRFASAGHMEMAKDIFKPIGLVEVIDDERLMDAVTALSGSGPAYAYLIIESLAEGGVKMGLPRELATILAAQSLLGGAKMVQQTGEHPAKLKDIVTTPAGVTIDGLMELEDGGLRVALIKAITKATEKSISLSR